MAGGDKPAYMQGKSFAGVLKGEEMAPLRDATYYRYWMHLVHHDVPAHFGIRTPDHKLIFYYSEHYDTTKYGTPSMWWKPESFAIEATPKAWEFYDLKKDPQELVNRYTDPAYQDIIKNLQQRLPQIRIKLGETDEDFKHLQAGIHEFWTGE